MAPPKTLDRAFYRDALGHVYEAVEFRHWKMIPLRAASGGVIELDRLPEVAGFRRVRR